MSACGHYTIFRHVVNVDDKKPAEIYGKNVQRPVRFNNIYLLEDASYSNGYVLIKNRKGGMMDFQAKKLYNASRKMNHHAVLLLIKIPIRVLRGLVDAQLLADIESRLKEIPKSITR